MLKLDKPAMEIAPIVSSLAGQSLTEGKKARASDVFQKSSHYGAAMAIDGDNATRWATNAGVGPCWLEADLGKPETFDRAVIDECTKFGVRVKAFQLQHQDGQRWKTFFQGTAMGPNREVKFPALTAQCVRLNITEGENGPTINGFQLFTPAKKNAP